MSVEAASAAEIVVPASALRAQLAAIFAAWGMPADQAAASVELLSETDLRGVDSHGLAMVPMYDDMRRDGNLVMAPEVRRVREAGATVVFDAGGGLGFYPAKLAMAAAIDKCARLGLGAASVRNSNHCGAIGCYAMMAAARGFIGIAMTAGLNRSVVPTRAAEALFGTNPIAFAAPCGRHPPLVLDMATSTVAVGKLKIAMLRGKAIPPGWAMDGAGKPVTDPTTAFAQRFLTPLGGLPEMSSHKGYGLAVMVETLATILAGAHWQGLDSAPATGRKYDVGHFMLAIDPAVFRDPDEFKADLDAMIDRLHEAKPVEPDLPVLVAGDPEHATRSARAREGVPVPVTLANQIRDVCARAGAAYLLG